MRFMIFYQSYSQVLAKWNMQIKSTCLAIQTGQAYAYSFAKLVLHNGVPEDAQSNQRDTVVLAASSTGTRSKGRLSSQFLNSFRCGGLVMTSRQILLALNPSSFLSESRRRFSQLTRPGGRAGAAHKARSARDRRGGAVIFSLSTGNPADFVINNIYIMIYDQYHLYA